MKRMLSRALRTSCTRDQAKDLLWDRAKSEAGKRSLRAWVPESSVVRWYRRLRRVWLIDEWYRVTDALKKLADPVPLWRAVSVPTQPNSHGGCLWGEYVKDVHLNPIGVHWTTERGMAQPYLGMCQDGSAYVLILGEVHAEDVDWEETVLARMDFEYGEEMEIRLCPGAFVRVTGMGVGSRGVPVPEGKIRPVNLLAMA